MYEDNSHQILQNNSALTNLQASPDARSNLKLPEIPNKTDQIDIQ